MQIKPGVSIAGLRPEMLIALMAADRIYTSLGYTLVVTSGLEGKHKGWSAHYLGLAVDIRIRDFAFNAEAPKVTRCLQADLGTSFKIYLHSTHIHMEFKPEGGANIA